MAEFHCSVCKDHTKSPSPQSLFSGISQHIHILRCHDFQGMSFRARAVELVATSRVFGPGPACAFPLGGAPVGNPESRNVSLTDEIQRTAESTVISPLAPMYHDSAHEQGAFACSPLLWHKNKTLPHIVHFHAGFLASA